MQNREPPFQRFPVSSLRLLNKWEVSRFSFLLFNGHEVDPPSFGRVELSGWKFAFFAVGSLLCDFQIA
jgi:hypothetical protein